MKKTISLILTCSLLLVCFCPAGAYGYEPEENRAGLFEALGVIDSKFMTKSFVTRGEFAIMLSEAMNSGFDETSLASEHPFDDVYKYEPGSGALYHLKKAGIIRGDGENKFNKEEKATVEQGYIMVLRALGCGALLEGTDALPVASVANSAGIRAGGDMGAVLTPDKAVDILFEMFHADRFGMSDYGGYNVEIDSRNFMEYYWDMHTVEGIVEANSLTNVSFGQDVTGEGKVRIDGKVYKDTSGRVAGLLGYMVTAYISDDSVVFALNNANNVLEITSDLEPEYSSFSISYYESDSKTRKAKLDRGFSIIYNGKTTDDILKLVPNDGKMTLIDNDGDKAYDVVLTEDYEYIFVSLVGSEQNVLDANNSPGLDLSEDIDKTVHIYDIRGKEITPGDIKKDTILRYSASEDENVINIHTSDKTMYGKITEIPEDDNSIFINGAEYKVNNYYKKHYGNIKLGEQGTFYFDDMGTITAIAVGEAEPEMKYGYLMAAKRDKNLDSKLRLKIMTETGEVKIFDVAGKCRIDGELLSTADGGADTHFVSSEGKTRYQLIRYAEEDNVITTVDTTQSNNDYDIFTTPVNSKDSLKMTSEKGARRYRSIGIFLPTSASDGFGFSGETVVFTVPESISGGGEASYNDDEFSTGLNLDNTVSYEMEAYNMDKSGCAEAIVIYGSASENVGSTSSFAVVYKTSEIYADAETTGNIVCYDGTSFKNLPFTQELNDKLKANGTVIKPGDVVRYNVNGKGYATAIKVDYSNKSEDIYTPITGIDSSFEMRKLYPLYVNNGYMIAKDDQGRQFVYNLSNVKFVEVTENRFNVTSATIDSIRCRSDYGDEASEIFLKLSYSVPNFAVVYNK